MNSEIATRSQMEEFRKDTLLAHDFVPTRSDVVISLTTVASRAGTLPLVLSRLIRQTIKGVGIELHISGSKEPFSAEHPSEWLRNLASVAVIEHDTDLGPAMKFLPALARDAQRAVIVVDDDVLYPADLVERLLAADARWQQRAAICYRGWRIAPDLSWERSVLSDPHPDDVRVGVITGHGGYCLRSKHVDLTELRKLSSAPTECVAMDDIWISGHLSRARTPKVLIAGSVRYKLPIPSAIGEDRERRNDIALGWFKQDWTAEDFEARIVPAP